MNSKKPNQQKAKIVTLADLSDKVTSDPIKVIKKPPGFSEERKIGGTKQTSKSVARPVDSKIPPKKPNPSGVILSKMPRKIGLALDPSKWRCNICTFLNENSFTICQVCNSMKGEKKIKGKK